MRVYVSVVTGRATLHGYQHVCMSLDVSVAVNILDSRARFRMDMGFYVYDLCRSPYTRPISLVEKEDHIRALSSIRPQDSFQSRIRTALFHLAGLLCSDVPNICKHGLLNEHSDTLASH